MKTGFVKALVAVSAIAMGSNAAYAATASADAKATILSPITVTKTADLDFGTIAVNAADTVTIAASSDTATCGATAGNLICAGTTSRAKFNVTGAANTSVSISSDANVTLLSGANSMSATLAKSAASATLSATGAASFQVGGALSVGATQAAGAYVGAFNVTVNYN
jgi:Mat/Ecp fimbriae major subunit